MPSIQWIALAVAAFAPLAAARQPAREAPQNPQAPVAPPAYRSAFDDYRPLQEFTEPPASHWRGLNDALAQAQHAGAAPQRPMPDAAPALPSAHRMQHRH